MSKIWVGRYGDITTTRLIGEIVWEIVWLSLLSEAAYTLLKATILS